MTTRQNEVRRILVKLNGHEPDDADVSRMANIAEAAEIAPGDALFPLMVALEYYRVTYESIPKAIKEASAFMLSEHANAYMAQAEKIAEDQNVLIKETTRQLLEDYAKWLKGLLPGIMSSEIEKAAKTAVSVPVNAAAKRFEDATAAADEEIVKLGKAGEALRKAGQSNKMAWAAVVFAAALLGGGVGGLSVAWGKNHFAPELPGLTKDQQDNITWGEATLKTYKNLPPQAQKMLMDAANGK